MSCDVLSQCETGCKLTLLCHVSPFELISQCEPFCVCKHVSVQECVFYGAKVVVTPHTHPSPLPLVGDEYVTSLTLSGCQG